jgi:hypothetical protein
MSKCLFAQSELEYLGHIISKDEVATNHRKSAAMVAWLHPTTITELKGFL